jgi:MFS family permease
VLGQSLVMYRFKDNFPSVVNSTSATGWLTSVLQLGGLVGSLSAGILGEIFSRKYTMFMAGTPFFLVTTLFEDLPNFAMKLAGLSWVATYISGQNTMTRPYFMLADSSLALALEHSAASGREHV